MDLVDEQDVLGLQVGQQRRQITGAFDGRPGGHAQVDAHLVRQDVRQGRLSQPGRPVEQDVVERLAASMGGLDQDLQVLLDPILADELPQAAGAQGDLVLVLRPLLLGDQTFLGGSHAADYTGLPTWFNRGHDGCGR